MNTLFVIDIDGTVADSVHRDHFVSGPGPKDWVSFFAPELVKLDPVLDGARAGVHRLMARTVPLVFLTGRAEMARKCTTDWLLDKLGLYVNHSTLLMRAEGDRRPAVLYKRDRVVELRKRFPEEHLVFADDDVEVHEMYWEFGLPLKAPQCWHVIP